MKKRQLKSALSAAVLGVLSPLAMALPAQAVTVSWGGHKEGFGDNLFSSGYNWDGGVAPSAGENWSFPGSGVSQTVDIDVSGGLDPVDVPSILFDGTFSGTSEKSYSLIGDAIDLLGNIEATMGGNGGNHSVGVDVNLQNDLTFKTTGANTLSVGETATILDLGANDLTLDVSGGTISLLGKVKGSGNIIKSGSGKAKIMLTPDAAGYTGGLTASAGEVSADSSTGMNITLSGGTLKGSGTVGNVAMSSGKVAPGNSPGVINTGNLDYTGGSFDVELGGKAAGEFDQTNVTGTVKLGSATTLNIALVNSYAPAVNDSFVIVNNDGSDAVEGTFSGLKDGAKVYGTYTYQINYDGGDGNDVVLLVTGNPTAPDTGLGSLINSPLATVAAAILVAGAIASYKVYDYKKK